MRLASLHTPRRHDGRTMHTCALTSFKHRHKLPSYEKSHTVPSVTSKLRKSEVLPRTARSRNIDVTKRRWHTYLIPHSYFNHTTFPSFILPTCIVILTYILVWHTAKKFGRRRSFNLAPGSQMSWPSTPKNILIRPYTAKMFWHSAPNRWHTK